MEYIVGITGLISIGKIVLTIISFPTISPRNEDDINPNINNIHPTHLLNVSFPNK